MKRVSCFFLTGVLLAIAPSAHGGTKEELIRLQSDVLALQNQFRLLEKMFNDQTESIKGLVGQLNDQVGKSNLILERMVSTLAGQQASDNSIDEALLQEVRNLGLKIDDTGTRVSALAGQISEMKVHAKTLNQRRFQTSGVDPGSVALSADTIFHEAYSDLVQGNLDLAIQGFSSYVTNFPSNENADDAQYYMGEAYYNANNATQAKTAFSKVVNNYPAGDKVPSALYKRGKAEMVINEQDNAIQDFKEVIERFPEAPESALAMSQLESLGVDVSKLRKRLARRRNLER